MSAPAFWALQEATRAIPVDGGVCFTGWRFVASAKTEDDAKATALALREQGALDVDMLPSYFLVSNYESLVL